MSNQPKPKFSIAAKYLGPIFSLDGEVTKNNQNLIFARNGTGKSFLSRAFRYLDLHGQGKSLDDAAVHLVSDESVTGKGEFAFMRGPDIMGKLQLDKSGSGAIAIVPTTIFHVFSEDFVQEELREREYEINGKIEKQITVDSDSINITTAKEVLSNAENEEKSNWMNWKEVTKKRKSQNCPRKQELVGDSKNIKI